MDFDYSSGDDLSSGDEYIDYIRKQVDAIRFGEDVVKDSPLIPIVVNGAESRTSVAHDVAPVSAHIYAPVVPSPESTSQQDTVEPPTTATSVVARKMVAASLVACETADAMLPVTSTNSCTGFWQDIGNALNDTILANDDPAVPLTVVTTKKKNNKKKTQKYPTFEVDQLAELPPITSSVKTFEQCDIFSDVHGLLRATHSIKPPTVAPNKICGPYASLHEYLHTQMHLLHNDYFTALQSGIRDIREQYNKPTEKQKTSSSDAASVPTAICTDKTGYGIAAGINSGRFWIFANKSITMQMVRKAKNCFVVKLSPKEVMHLRRMDALRNGYQQQQSHDSVGFAGSTSSIFGADEDDDKANLVESCIPFMFGSLLLFSPTMQMNELTLATVVSLSLENNLVQILPMRAFNAPAFLEKPMFMLEPKPFFDPTHQIHRVLADHDASTFPLQSQIVQACSQSIQPGYRQAIAYEARSNIKLPLQPANVVWPAADRLGYNESQLAAIRHALTHRMALIQGPPGTGKSFVGRELVGLLMHNTAHRILIVCNSNQALDQFLNGLVVGNQFGIDAESVVRMGNQSKDPVVKQFCKRDDKGDMLKTPIEVYEAISVANAKIGNKQRRIAGGSDCSDLNALLEEGVLARRRLDERHRCNDFEQVRTKRIIGMTSSFAAKSASLLRQLQVPIVIVEEAAEMLEAHVVAALTKFTQHLIQIGDHKQLRPRTCSHKSGGNLNMDVSLFERLHNNNFPAVALTQQHRMHPMLADLIRPNIYAYLTDAPNVHKYPEVVGMPGRVQFIDHRWRERASGPSRINVGEAKMVQLLCRYLLLQGYGPVDITVLCTYRAQIYELETDRGSGQCYGCEIAVVDGFQGRESRIVLLSLVRNNADACVGFMSAANRACVALSRAREALYIFGNMPMLVAAGSAPWMHVKKRLTQISQGINEKELVLQCVQHGILMQISNPEKDGWIIANGGCSGACASHLPCHHLCGIQCHAQTIAHKCPAGCTVYE